MTLLSRARVRAAVAVVPVVALLLAVLPATTAPALPDPFDGTVPPWSALAGGDAVTVPTPTGEGIVRAGAAKVDATWRVGASAGQYAGKGPGMYDPHGQAIEPHQLSSLQVPSHGIHSRDWVRALVLEGPDGSRFASVANDLYIPQDLINRRVAGILVDHDRQVALGLAEGPATGISAENLAVSVSHNHSSPYYSALAWGAWAFQDVFDLRFFEHYATAMADAVIAAASDLRPARVGGAASIHTLGKRHAYGPAIADDGTPAGYASTDFDPDLTVVAVDDMTDPDDPQPLATWVVFGLHPEHLKTPQVLTSEWVGALYRVIDREVGGVTLVSQNDIGTSEPARQGIAHPPSWRQEMSEGQFAQMERQARQLGDAVKATRADIDRGTEGAPLERAHTVVAYATDVPIASTSLRFAPPGARVSPTVSSCRTEQTFKGNPGVPVVGLPNCQFPFGDFGGPAVETLGEAGLDPAVTYDRLREAGVPIPDNVGFPSYVALQEALQVHLQALRIGEIGITICPCEQFADQSRNIKTRLNRTEGDLWFGWDWTANPTHEDWEPGIRYDGATGPDGEYLPGHGPAALGFCTQPDGDGGDWLCRDPRRDRFAGIGEDPNVPELLAPIPDAAFRRMKAQLYNDAAGWDAPGNALAAEADPIDPADIWGNWTHEELHDVMDDGGYALVATVAMANDYFGYIPTYREFQQGDHYRKALAGLGPHSADFLATRLARMAASLKGGPAVERGLKDIAYDLDGLHQQARAEGLGRLARAWLPAYEATLPADGGSPRIVAEPSDVERFSAAAVTFVGGSNWVDSPHAVVERCLAPSEDLAACEGAWERYADGEGDVQVRGYLPTPAELPAWRAGAHEWRWEATFEAFSSDIAMPDAQGVPRRQTPAGLYRFVVEGCHRGAVPLSGEAGACGSADALQRVAPYRLESAPFAVRPWSGIEVIDLEARPRGEAHEVTFGVGPVYPLPASTSNTRRGPIDYPDTYDSPFQYIRGDRTVRSYGGDPADDEAFCLRCAFRPWADTGAPERASVLVIGSDGRSSALPARWDVERQRFVAAVPAWAVSVEVPAGAVRDELGETNGSGAVLRLDS
jgi:hypothetical protein